MKTKMTALCLRVEWLIFAGMFLLSLGAAAQNLYELDYVSGNINEFTPPGQESTVAQIPFNATPPYAFGTNEMAFDGQGDLYVSAGPYILEFPNASGALQTTPTVFYYSNDALIIGLAFDSSGDLFESEMSGGGIIHEFAKTPTGLNASPTVLISGFPGAAGLAFDNDGNLYVSAGDIYEFVNSGGTLSKTPNDIASIATGTFSMAFDGLGDLYYTLGEGLSGSSPIYELVNNGNNMFGTPVLFAPFNGPGCIAFDIHGNLFAASPNDNAIYEWPNTPGAGLNPNSMQTFASGLNGSFAIAFPPPPPEPVQGLYDVDYGTENINVFTPQGQEIPVALIPPPYDYGTNGMAFDSFGDLFVSSTSYILEFANNNGTLSTAPVVFNSAGGYYTGLAFDSTGDLFAADGENGTISEFIYSGGNLSATATPVLSGLSGPVSLAFDSAGDLFECDSLSDGGGDNNINEFTKSGSTFNLTPLVIGSIPSVPVALGFDIQSNLFDAGFPSPDTPGIYEFVKSGMTFNPTPTLFSPFAPMNYPGGLVFDSDGNMYASSPQSGVIYEWLNSGGVLSSSPSTFSSGLAIPRALAFLPSPLSPSLQGMVQDRKFFISVRTSGRRHLTIVQRSSDLKKWTNVYTNMPPFTYADSLSASLRFYRGLVDKNAN